MELAIATLIPALLLCVVIVGGEVLLSLTLIKSKNVFCHIRPKISFK